MRLAHVSCLCLVVVVCQVNALSADEDFGQLIDQLVNVSQPDSGYAESFSGKVFLPYGDSEELGTFVFGGTARQHSPVMLKLVQAGAKAVPELLKHLSDDRLTKLPTIEAGGGSWISFDNHYDFNRATIGPQLNGTRTSTVHDSKTAAQSHEITVGDLCFVALGQIVNRHWDACRYQPTGGRIISSPTASPRLHQQIIDEWSKLDEATHRAKLLDDFRHPDNVSRIIGAYWRLSLYYPDEVEPLVLELLRKPLADEHLISKLCEELESAKTPTSRRQKLKVLLQITASTTEMRCRSDTSRSWMVLIHSIKRTARPGRRETSSARHLAGVKMSLTKNC